MSEEKAIYDKNQSYTTYPEERKLLDFFRNELVYGEATVIVRKGKPVFVQIARRDVKLD